MSASILTVSQINTYIKMLLDGDNNLRNVFVSGEISNFNNNYRSGHFYFSLKDDKSVIKAVMFSSNASRVRFKPMDGMKVIVSGRVSLYEATGQYQLYVESMQPDGIGALAIAYEQLKNKLESEGLFDDEHKLPIPMFPKKIGVITSPTGAVIQDIKNVVSRRCPISDIVLCPVAVQGELAPPQLTEAVKLFNKLNNVDVIIIGRGGGSFEDLNCFNDETLIRTIYDSEVPIISAVGHETDFTLCDFVSDLRAPTPSAAAELAVPDRNELLKNIGDIFGKIENTVSDKLYSEMQFIDKLNDTVRNLRPDNYIANEYIYLDSLKKEFNYIIENKIKINKTEITALANKVNTLNPINLLNKGYSIVIKNNVPVNSVVNMNLGENISVRMSDGTVKCRVESINKFGD
ncbi:MAG: exodeoxyribonuclease VII large subunit [Clostridia bacterium]|nr:exodeoxyribonuclease VII large subunit [Clostridia bacterium]